MRALYTALLFLTLPLALLRLGWRSLRAPAYRQRWAERLGRIPEPPASGGIWVHAVSVGEVQAIAPLIRHLLSAHPQLPLCITTTTPTGSERVRRLFADDVFHVYCPYDLPFALRGFLDRVRPQLTIMVETEIWPNLLAACARRGIPTLLANGRLSEASARGYARLGRFSRATFGQIAAVAAQAPADAERFIALGVAPDRVRVTGSIKFDAQVPASVAEQAQVLRRSWGVHRPVWVAASTHEGEEEQVLEAHAQLLRTVPDALLVLVPRHPERFERVAGLVRKRGFRMVRRSAAVVCGRDVKLLLGDTMGELVTFIGAADAAFIGGSLVPVGGHNMLEAAAQGVPVVIGPHLFNFAAVSRLLLEQGAAVQVEDAAGLGALLAGWLTDAAVRARVGQAGRRVVEGNRGALPALIAMVEVLLDAGEPPPQ
jgi:3-deoxy-D-manno-octulosonic-acid transferase